MMAGKGMTATTSDKLTPLGKFLQGQIEALKKGPFVKVGFPRPAYDKPHKSKGGAKDQPTVGEIAVTHEFGWPEKGIPERSFLRSTHDEKKDTWRKRTKALQQQVIAGKLTAEQALGQIASVMKGDIQEKINSNIPPPNSAETIARKGSSRTLIDTSQMKQSVHYTVHKDKREMNR